MPWIDLTFSERNRNLLISIWLDDPSLVVLNVRIAFKVIPRRQAETFGKNYIVPATSGRATANRSIILILKETLFPTPSPKPG